MHLTKDFVFRVLLLEVLEPLGARTQWETLRSPRGAPQGRTVEPQPLPLLCYMLSITSTRHSSSPNNWCLT